MSGSRIESSPSAAEWDDLVSRAPGGTFFHTDSWLRHFGSTCRRIAIRSDRRLLAGLAVDLREPGRPGSLTPYLGPLYGEASEAATRAVRALAQRAAAEFPRGRFCTSPWARSAHPLLEAGYTARLHYTNEVDLADLQATWRRFRPGLRSNVRAARRAKLTVAPCEAPSRLLNLVRSTFSRQEESLWFSNREAVSAIVAATQLGRFMTFVCSAPDGTDVAGVGIAWHRARAHYLLGGYNPTQAHRGGTSLALWTAMTYVRERMGVTSFDLEGTDLPHLARFFRQFRAVLRPFYSAQLPENTVPRRTQANGGEHASTSTELTSLLRRGVFLP